MPTYVEYILAFLLVAGGIFALIGSWGLAKLNDFYMRLHGPTKATTLGLGGILTASMIFFSVTEPIISLHEILITVFLFITAPVSAHLLAKTALAERFRFSSDQENPLNHPLNVGTRQTHDTTGVDFLEDADEAYKREMESEEAAMMRQAHAEDDLYDEIESRLEEESTEEGVAEEEAAGEEAAGAEAETATEEGPDEEVGDEESEPEPTEEAEHPPEEEDDVHQEEQPEPEDPRKEEIDEAEEEAAEEAEHPPEEEAAEEEAAEEEVSADDEEPTEADEDAADESEEETDHESA